MPTKPTDRLSKDQLISGLHPSNRTHGHFECPVCRGQHLTIFGQNDDLSCKSPEQTAECNESNITRKIRERLGIGFKPRIPTIDEREDGKVSNEVSPSGLGLQLIDYAMNKILPVDWLKDHFVLRDGKHPYYKQLECAVEFPYFDETGKHKSSQWRWGMGKNDRRNEAKKPTYLYAGRFLQNLNEKAKAGDGAQQLFVVEGQSNTQTMWLNGLPCVGLPGVGNWKAEWAKLPLFECADTIYFVLDMKDGKPETQAVRGSEKFGNSFPPGKVRTVQLPCKDVSDLWKQDFGDHTAFMSELQKAVSKSVAVISEPEKPGDRVVESVLSSAIEPRRHRWLWQDHIPLEQVTVFGGMPEKGKSTVAIDVVAKLTTGRDFPYTKNENPPCEVAILASEDDADTTTVPRLIAARANRDKVHIITGSELSGKRGAELPITLDTDLPLLRAWLKLFPEVRLFVIDPVTSYIGEVDPNKPKEVRPFLVKLKAFAKEMNIAILLIMHMSKNPEVAAMHRIGGAATWVEVPRAVWFFDIKKLEEGSTELPSNVMVNGKLNIVASDRKKSLEFRFVSVSVEVEGKNDNYGTIQWGSESAVTLEEQYSKPKNKTGPAPEKRSKAGRWLKKYLADGPKKAAQVEEDCKSDGLSFWTVQSASKEIGVVKERRNDVWWWKLPERTTLDEVDAGERY